MTTVKDTQARRIAVVALVAAIGAFMLGSARADSVSEPDAAALEVRVKILELQVADLTTAQEALNDRADTASRSISDLFENDQEFDRRTGVDSPSACLAYSDFHYFKERVDGSKRVRLPVVVWNMSVKECRPSAKPWMPKRRVLTPVVASR